MATATVTSRSDPVYLRGQEWDAVNNCRRYPNGQTPIETTSVQRTLAYINELVCQRAKKWGGFNRDQWFKALVGEIGEAANVDKKLDRLKLGMVGNNGTTQTELEVKLGHEMGDIFIYLLLWAHECGVDLEQAVVHVFNKKSEELNFAERL